MNVLIRDAQDAVMCPIPQYPLYSAALTLYGGSLVPYYLDEEHGWSMNIEHLKSQLVSARAEGKNVRALVVINPGNPTGNVLSDENLLDIAKFCADEGIMLISDEVYQENIYREGKTFKSMRKVVYDGGLEKRLALLSFHSISKGYYGECGRRGGFMELTGAWDDAVVDALLKLASIALCPNLAGQVLTSLVMEPPVPGEPSYDLFIRERDDILSSLKRRSIKLSTALNALEGVSCNAADGAMYCFPNLTFPKKFLDDCEAAGKVADVEYCTRLLMATGIVTVPGSGFGQKPGTWHFRTTFLPSEEDIESVSVKLADFHENFMAQYK
jgi:alanine transaminase